MMEQIEQAFQADVGDFALVFAVGVGAVPVDEEGAQTGAACAAAVIVHAVADEDGVAGVAFEHGKGALKGRWIGFASVSVVPGDDDVKAVAQIVIAKETQRPAPSALGDHAQSPRSLGQGFEEGQGVVVERRRWIIGEKIDHLRHDSWIVNLQLRGDAPIQARPDGVPGGGVVLCCAFDAGGVVVEPVDLRGEGDAHVLGRAWITPLGQFFGQQHVAVLHQRSVQIKKNRVDGHVGSLLQGGDGCKDSVNTTAINARSIA